MSNTPGGEMTNPARPLRQRRTRSTSSKPRPPSVPGTSTPPSRAQGVPEGAAEGHRFKADGSPAAGLRPTGLDVVGPVAWGSHFCQFYESKQDLLDILVPYFRAGLENNEFCMWVTSHPLDVGEATAALASVVPDLDRRIAVRQIEVLDYHQWYVPDGKFDADRVLQGWVDKLTAALHRGFEGLRLTGNTFWLEKSLWKDFSDYEAVIDRVIGQYRMLALCTYSLEKCGVFEVMDVVRNHQFTLIRQGGQWEILQSLQRQAAELALRASEQRYRTLFSTMSEGFALSEIICDPEGRPCDYRFLEANAAFERQTGLKAADLIGRTVREVLPDVEPLWIEQFGRVALMGQPARVEAWSGPLGRCYDVRAFQAGPGRFAVVFSDITERKLTEEAMQNAALIPEQNPAPVLRIGRDGTLLYANLSSTRLLESWGCQRGQVVPEEIRAHIARALQTNETTEVEVACGPVIYGFSVGPVVADHYVNLYGRDITERKRAEEAIQSVALFPEQNPSPVLRVDHDGTLLYANGPSADLLEAWGCRAGQTIPAEIRSHVERALDAGAAMEVELTCGSVVYSFSIAPIPSEDYANLYGRDITERKRAEKALHDAHGHLQLQAEELAAQAEELRTANEELCEHEQALRQAKERWERTFDSVPDLIAIIDDQHRVVQANRAMIERLGLKPGQCVELPCHKAVHGTDAPPSFCPHRQTLQDGCEHMVEVHEDRLGGDFLVSTTPLRDEHGQMVGSVHVARDITERKRAEQALAESEQRLRLALEGGRMGRWEWNLQTGLSFWDERVYELLGLDPRVPARTETFFTCVDPRDRDTLGALVEKTLADQENLQAEFRIVQRNGQVLWLSSRGKVIRDVPGQAVRMIGVMYDVTPRKQMEEQLRQLNDQLEEEVQAQTEELRDTIDRLQDEVARRVLAEGKLRKHAQMLEAFFQHTITPLAFMDKYFNFVRVNEAYARADGKGPEYFIGKNHFALYPHPENRAIFEQVVASGQPYFANARPFRYPDDPGRVTYWDWQLTPLSSEVGDVQFLVLNLEDVTARQNAFQEIEHRARQLQKLTLELSQAEDRERKRLAEILHDDLQQQLAAAKFHLGILGNRVKGDGALQEITGRVNDMLKEAIEQSRSLSHELSPAVLCQGDLSETFEWLARQVRAKHGLTVHVEVRGRVDSPSEGMKTFLYKAAQEILFNVVKHSRVKEATLRLQRSRRQLWLTISDKGQGFDPKALGKTGGFGLLSIRERIELLGGRMKIKSAVGKGSTFLIAVPDERVPEGASGGLKFEVSSARSSHAAPGTPKGSSADRMLRVLLADDHEVMRQGLATLLTEQGDIEIVGQAGNGREAVDLAYRLQPDVVIMDAAMPVMAGDEATRQIKQSLPGTRVVALSMCDEPAVAERMRKAGAATYLLKTAPPEELLAAIRARA